MELKDLVGEHYLQGIETGQMLVKRYLWEERANFILFRLDDVNYKAIEDPNDGYRSYMEDLEITDEVPKFSIPNVRVIGSMMPDSKWGKNDVIEFRDVSNGEIVLRIGTEEYNDYYPTCILEYTPENFSCNK